MPQELFDKQFENFKRYFDLGLDLYGYVTFTANDVNDVEEKIAKFIKRLTEIHPLLPLRIVPLKISIFTPVQSRLNPDYINAVENQKKVYKEWRKQLEDMYESSLLNSNICDIKLR